MTNSPPNLESLITPALVDRVSQRLAMGMPLKIALAGEGVKRAEYKEHLRQHPELEELQDIAKRKFLENAFNVMLDGENAAANFRWLIELVYPNVLGSENDESAKPNQKQTIVGLPEETLERMREYARNAEKYPI